MNYMRTWFDQNHPPAWKTGYFFTFLSTIITSAQFCQGRKKQMMKFNSETRNKDRLTNLFACSLTGRDSRVGLEKFTVYSTSYKLRLQVPPIKWSPLLVLESCNSIAGDYCIYLVFILLKYEIKTTSYFLYWNSTNFSIFP